MSRGARLAVLGAAICALAGAFAVPALYVPGVGLVLVAAGAAASVWAAASGARVELALAADRIIEGEDVLASARVAGPLAGSARGELTLLSGSAPSPLGLRSRSAALRVRPARRGRTLVGPARAHWSDPFGLCSREREGAPCELLVLPRVQPLRGREVERILALPDAAAAAGAGLEPDGLAPYRPGSPASRVHWLTLARTGTPMERRLIEPEGRRPVTIALDALGPDDEEALDRAVRATASLCVALAAAGGCGVLLPGLAAEVDLGPDMAGWPRLHELLALIEGGAPAWQQARGARRLVLVQAHRPQPPRGLHVGCSVSPLPQAGVPVLFTVAGCAVQPLGQQAAGRVA